MIRADNSKFRTYLVNHGYTEGTIDKYICLINRSLAFNRPRVESTEDAIQICADLFGTHCRKPTSDERHTRKAIRRYREFLAKMEGRE